MDGYLHTLVVLTLSVRTVRTQCGPRRVMYVVAEMKMNNNPTRR